MSHPPIHIFNPHDVVFARVGSKLHFDQNERNFSGIGAAMNFALLNEDVIAFMQLARRVALCYVRGAGNNDPMLGAMVMFLQREARAVTR